MLTMFMQTYAAMMRAVQADPGKEVTGMITASLDRREESMVPMTNVHRDPTKFYEWDAGEMAEQWALMDARGHEPIAFFHSHPHSSPEPSETDMLGALHERMHYVIAGQESPGMWRVQAYECVERGILVSTRLVQK